MASTMKLKFAGLLRGLLRQNDNREPVRPVAAPTPPPASATAPATTPPAAASSTETEPSTLPDAKPVTEAKKNDIAIPLAPVISHLPMDLRAKLMSTPQPEQTISLPVETIVSQLAFGAVKITFGELRQLAPGLFANSSGEHDSRPVSLPLPEILSRLNPTLLSRRSAQKVEVADEIVGPFGGRGRGVSFTTQPLKPAAAKPPVAESNRSIPFNTPPPATPPAHPPIVPRGNHPVSQPVPSAETEVFSFKPRQTALPSAPIPFNPPAKPATNGNNVNGNGNGSKSLPPFKFSTTPTPTATAAAAPAPRSEPPKAPLFITLDDLAENWPEVLKSEILRSSLANASVPLPMNVVEPGLKQGRVTMKWKELRMLAKPSSPPSPNDGLELDLPLKVLAPAFLAAQKRMFKSQSRVGVSEDIPNLFFGFPQSAPTAPPPAHAPAAAPASKSSDTNFYVWGDDGEMPMTDERTLDRPKPPATDFLSRQTHPREVVARAKEMTGVAGAVVALADGLRVASEIPAEMNAEAIAAFLPQIFERVHQTTRELRMGALNNVSFTVGNAPWKIFRVQSVYFAAFGRAGEALPSSQLAALAAELDRKK